MKGFLAGLVVGVLLVIGGIFYYFVSGMAPVAANDPPMPFEKKMASRALAAHIAKEGVPVPQVPADEPNLLGGAKVYKENCAGCHGLPDQTPPTISNGMFPNAPLLFKGKGVTDDPPQESYWKAANGIRLSGMPRFNNTLTNVQLWQVAQLVAHANEIPDSVKKALAPDPLPAAPMMEPAKTPPSKPK